MDLQSSQRPALAPATFNAPVSGARAEPAVVLDDARRAALLRSMPTMSSDPLSMVLATMRTGLVLVGADARVAYMNEAARQALAASIGLALAGDRVVVASPDARRRFAVALARACRAPFVDGAVLLRTEASGASGRAVRVLSMRRIEGPLRAHDEGTAMICIGHGRQSLPEPSMLSQLFGLTATEAALMAAVAGGERLAQCATRRGVSLSTVRAQLRNVFVKTGAGTQADLTKIAWSIPGLWLN